MSSYESWLPLLVAASTSLSLILLLFLPSSPSKDEQGSHNDGSSKDRIQVVVLGDIGHSPRMQYHVLSIAKHGTPVDLIGLLESSLPASVVSNPLIQVHAVPPTPAFLKTDNKILFLVLGVFKAVYQFVALWVVLRYRTKPAKWIIVQNPPSIPTLAVAQCVAFLRNSRLIVDWHNLGYSRLALRLGSKHPFVWIARQYERVFTRYATAHFTVTDAMARMLRSEFLLTSNIFPLHDRPASHFLPLSDDDRLAFLHRLPETASFADSIAKKKMRLLVSSTSWTPDEDFSLLLTALVQYSDLAMTSHPYLPEILVVVTGKGPLKEHFLAQIATLKSQDKLELITFKTAWLSTEDYASLLGAADVGVSLHQSTSGVDLPMKVLDMFGAGLPVVGWSDFEAWPELVTEGINGRGFKSAEGLQNALMELFGGDGTELQTLREGAIHEGSRRWDDEWDSVAGRLLGLCP